MRRSRPGRDVDAYTIRPFATTEEYRECVALQEATWGEGFSERVSPAILKVAQILGGVAAGAYDADGRLVGFVFGMTGLRHGEIAHWSDMLAVLPEARDAGLGRRLKAYQRDQVMARGVETMYWTFDPLQARNAYLNLTKLGAVVREYEVNMYGDTDSPLHRGIGTDRFIALWLLSSPRVVERMAVSSERSGRRPVSVCDEMDVGIALQADVSAGPPRPSPPFLGVGHDCVGVQIPSDIGGIMKDDMTLAQRWREATREVFLHYLAAGYEVSGFVRENRVSSYLLSRVPPDGGGADT